ncbi:MAG: hypothetical protein ACK559_31450, partial [bacterium]
LPDGPEAGGQLGGIGLRPADGPELALRPHEALGQRGRGREQGAGDAGDVHPEHHLEHHRRVQGRGHGRVRAGEHQAEPAVGQARAERRPELLLELRAHAVGGGRAGGAAAVGVDGAPAGRGQQPGLRA